MISKLFTNKLIKTVFFVASGTAGAQLITVLCSPIITRLYGPELFGLLGSFIAMGSMILPIMAFSYSMAIILPKKNHTAVQLLLLSIFLSISISFLIFLALYFNSSFILNFFALSNLQWMEYIIPLYLLSLAVFEAFTYWALRKKMFFTNSKLILFKSILSNGLKIYAGYYAKTPVTLIVVTTVVTLMTIFLYMYVFRSILFKGTIKVMKFRYYKLLAFSYSDFLVYRTPQRLLSGINQSLPIIMLSSLFSPSVAGYFTLCRSILMMPLNLVAKSVSDVLFPNVNERYLNGQPIFPLLLKATFLLALVGLIPLIIIVLYAPPLFMYIFGEQWYQSGIYAQWFSIWLFFNFINRPSLTAVAVLKFEKLLLLNSTLNFILIFSALYFGNVIGDDIITIALFSLVGVIPQLIIILGVLTKARNHDIYIKGISK
ncbi:lipopolysaccharide biosynthesis protein [Pseudoalteromonas sp. SR43-5]|uniref:lipopolysaccharide biosynthesis protein n=1 Tax=Pseudoalteromonas sp. SR43-5 TaxID=2760941 RepID=UPI00217578FF|nr:oligosaccharide flippase family protein [Pseudoalteromonas sp. SR43-5]